VAYGFARLRGRGRNVLFLLLLATLMIPREVTIVPRFLLFQRVGLVNTLWPLILPAWFGYPFFIFLLRQFFMNIPKELEDAALIDGCTWLQMLTKILLPAAMPGLVAAGMFAFMTAWNDYLFAVILTSTTAAKTLPVVVAGFATDVTTERTLMATSGVLAIVPPLALALLCQRLIVQGLTSGAVKE
jgi:multiple sugar transport system permease protein